MAGKGPLTASIMRQLLSALCLDPMLHHLLFKAGERATTHAKSFPTMNLINFIALATVSSSSAFSVPRVASVTNRVSSLNARRCGITDMPTRRDTLQSWLVGASTLSTGFLASPDQVMAFSNKISNQYDDRPKQRGSKVGFALHHLRLVTPLSTYLNAILFTASRTRCINAERHGRQRILGTETMRCW